MSEQDARADPRGGAPSDGPGAKGRASEDEARRDAAEAAFADRMSDFQFEIVGEIGPIDGIEDI